MLVKKTPLPGLLELMPKRHHDPRGFFAEIYSWRVLEQHDVTEHFVQENYSLSVKVGTVRGLHFQTPPAAQGKLVRCSNGAIFDVAVDIRRGSPTFGQWVGHELSSDNGKQLYIPAGFAHGFASLSPNCEIVYKCTDYYAPESEGGLRWNDPDIGIDWPVSGDPTISEKDALAPFLAEFDSPFAFEAAS